MRKLLMGILLVVIGGNVVAADCLTNTPPARVDTNLLTQDDRFVPWPWSLRKTFPWAVIEGTWLAQNGAFQSYYTFKIGREGDLRRFVVRQIDMKTCHEVAFGQGYASRGRNNIMVAMDYISVRQTYGIYVRSYEYGGPLEDNSISPIDGQVMMLSIQPQGRTDYVHFAISKISNDSSASFCKEIN